MSKKAANPRNFVYPASTAGSEAAKRLRAEANKFSEQQRDDLFKRGMQIIYGGPGTKKRLARDTNLLFDLAAQKDFAHTFREVYQERG